MIEIAAKSTRKRGRNQMSEASEQTVTVQDWEQRNRDSSTSNGPLPAAPERRATQPAIHHHA